MLDSSALALIPGGNLIAATVKNNGNIKILILRKGKGK